MSLFPIKGVLDTGSGLEEEEMVWNSHLPSLFCMEISWFRCVFLEP